MKAILDQNYIQGMKDCRDGKESQSSNHNYLLGYGMQYQINEMNSWNAEVNHGSAN